MHVINGKTIMSLFSIQVYNIISPNNKGGNVQETIIIDNEKNTAIINIHAGSCSSTTIFDYKHVSSKGIFIFYKTGFLKGRGQSFSTYLNSKIYSFDSTRIFLLLFFPPLNNQTID